MNVQQNLILKMELVKYCSISLPYGSAVERCSKCQFILLLACLRGLLEGTIIDSSYCVVSGLLSSRSSFLEAALSTLMAMKHFLRWLWNDFATPWDIHFQNW